MTMWQVLSITFVACWGIAWGDAALVQLETPLGMVEGTEMVSWGGNKFSAFTGIPYAQPPVGSLRFKPPLPTDPWKGTLNARDLPPKCVQQDKFTKGFPPIEGQEDCLYLNVYTPQLPNDGAEPLAVMFFIHGGGFLCGHGRRDLYGPEFFMDKNVILVTFNYRLGALGFLSTGDEVVPGNNGLKDQSLALKWVHDNIGSFGGDPDRITIFGQSAGGASTHFHLFSPLSRGLFSGAIAQSGTVLGNWAIGVETAKLSKKLGKMLGCSGSNEDMVKCLRKINAYKIAAQEIKFVVWDVEPLIPFKPIVEVPHEGAFLPEHPWTSAKNGRSADVPFITGLTSEDGAIRSAQIMSKLSLVEDLDKNFNKIFPVLFDFPGTISDKDLPKKVRQFYFGDKPIDVSTKNELTNLYTDMLFIIGADDSIKLHKKYHKNPIFYYNFAYEGTNTMTEIYSWDVENYGTCHTDDLLYLFPFDMVFVGRNLTKYDLKMVDTLTTLWTNFAKTRNPTPETNDLIKTQWKPVSSEETEFLYIGDTLKMDKDLYGDRLRFWRKVLPKSKHIPREEL